MSLCVACGETFSFHLHYHVQACLSFGSFIASRNPIASYNGQYVIFLIFLTLVIASYTLASVCFSLVNEPFVILLLILILILNSHSNYFLRYWNVLCMVFGFVIVLRLINVRLECLFTGFGCFISYKH